MKIKFVAPDLAAFTGMYGSIEFKDGLSVTDVTEQEVRLYGAITAIEVVGEGFTPDKTYDEVKNVGAVVVNLPTLAEIRKRAAAVATALMAPAAGQEVSAPATVYTKEQLEAIADKQGIAGLRAIGEQMGVRATSISKLIREILEAQAKHKPAAEFLAAPAEAVTLTMTDPLVADKAE